jgi:hypothetical protein
MIFSKKNAGKWVASKDSEVIASSKNLDVLMKKLEKHKDKKDVRFDLVPKNQYFAGICGIFIR